MNQPARPLAVAVLGRGVIDPDTPVIHADDRGLLRGLAAFETLRVYAGRPFAMSEHLARLAASAERMHLAVPDLDALAGLADEAVAAAGVADCTLRLTLTGGREGGQPVALAIVGSAAGRPGHAARRRHRRRLAAAGHRPSRAPGCPVAARRV